MCGDGPTIPESIDTSQNDRTVQHTAGLSTTHHAMAASIALRSFGANALLAPTQSASHCISQSEPHTLLRRLATYTGTGCVSKYRKKQSHATCRLLFAKEHDCQLKSGRSSVSLANAARGHIGEVVDLRLAQLMIRSNAPRFLWSLASEQISGNNFQEMHLVAAGSSTPMKSQSTKSQSTQSKARPAAKLRSAAKRKVTDSTRSSDTLLGELKQIASEVINKDVSVDAPLMDAGLDSISTRELSTKISAHLNTELSPTLLFDHPSLRSIADALSADSGSAPAPEFEPKQELPVLTTVTYEATKRAVSHTSRNAMQSTASIITSIQTTL